MPRRYVISNTSKDALVKYIEATHDSKQKF
jgi:hypothetical protein